MDNKFGIKQQNSPTTEQLQCPDFCSANMYLTNYEFYTAMNKEKKELSLSILNIWSLNKRNLYSCAILTWTAVAEKIRFHAVIWHLVFLAIKVPTKIRGRVIMV